LGKEIVKLNLDPQFINQVILAQDQYFRKNMYQSLYQPMPMDDPAFIRIYNRVVGADQAKQE
jgi:hypothetical protein